jgi:hypothetical protein
VWTLQELLNARSILASHLSEEEVCERYRWVGGVPRHVFSADLQEALAAQDHAVAALTKDQAIAIALNTMDANVKINESMPKSAVIGIVPKRGCEDYTMYSIVVISPSVSEKVYFKFMGDMWQQMLQSEYEGWAIFEAYTRQLMIGTSTTTLNCRKCVGLKDAEYKQEFFIEFENCKRIRLVVDIATAVARDPDPNVLYHSVDRRYKLIDFIYRSKDNVFHAFQVTIANDHKCDEVELANLYTTLGSVTKTRKRETRARRLKLYYLVPGERFKSFVSTVVQPKCIVDGVNVVDIYHVCVPNPRSEQV